MAKIQWYVDPPPTGPYRSFQFRMWPAAQYSDNDRQHPAAQIGCVLEYTPARAKQDVGLELRVSIADHSIKPWRWIRLSKTFPNLKSAKEAAQKYIEAHPEKMPADIRKEAQ